jgi:two-component system CheB/CheR fusion protein
MAKRKPSKKTPPATARRRRAASPHVPARHGPYEAPHPQAQPAAGDGQEQPAENATVEEPDRQQDWGPDFPVVGIGASAGGLEAFSQVLNIFPADSGMALVLVQHLSPKHESMLAELLTGSTAMRVVQISDGMTIEPSHVYVAPPGSQVAIRHDGRFHLAPRPADHTQHTPIDSFLRSLAEYAQERAVGVVLSGTASDGSAGLKEIKAVGGITLAQDPKTARYDGMPRAAIATGAVDLVLPPQQIASELMRIARHPFVRPTGARRAPEAALPAADDQLHRIFTMLRSATGVDFTHYKQPTIKRRLQRRMVLHKITSLDQYIKFMQQNGEEVQSLYADILIHVTRFFREPDSFKLLADVVFPSIMHRRHGDEPLRVWVPGCATGEEAYSVAIALLEFLDDAATGTTIQVFATDVSESAIEQARAGLFHDTIAEDVSADRLRRFFTRSDGHYRISKAVRDLCIFARQDLTRDPPFSKLDLIMCRNVLIYLGTVLQRRLMGVFHYALKPSGFLMLGSAETVGASSDLFALADKRHRLYTRKMTVVRSDMHFAPREPARSDRQVKDQGVLRSATTVQAEASRVILERYSPPGVIVDGDMQIVQFRGHTGKFLEPAPGDANLNVLKMAREGLLYGLRTALSEARRGGTPARKDGQRVKYNGHVIDVNIEVIPLDGGHQGRHFLILFQDTTKDPAEEPRPRRNAKAAPRAAKASRSSPHDQQRLARSRRSWPPAANTSNPSSRTSRPPTRSSNPRTRKSSPATRSSRAPTRSSTPPRRSFRAPTRN